MSKLYPVPAAAAKRALMKAVDYERIYQQSIEDPDQFWLDQAKRLDWVKFPQTASNVSWNASDLHIRWFEDGELNACYNCIDRHLKDRSEQTAIIWEGDDPGRELRLTYGQLH